MYLFLKHKCIHICVSPYRVTIIEAALYKLGLVTHDTKYDIRTS